VAIRRNPSAGKFYSVDTTVGWVSLHLDEVDHLLDFLRTRASKVSLMAGDQLTLDGGADIPNVSAQDRRMLRIDTSEPSFSIHLYPLQAALLSFDKSTGAKALGLELTQYFEEHRASSWEKWKRALHRNRLLLPLLLIAGVGLNVALGAFNQEDLRLSITYCALYALAFAAVLWCVARAALPKSGVILRLETRDSARKLRTARILKAASYLLGAVVTAVITLYVGYLFGAENPK
jgi:hypothetical protein